MFPAELYEVALQKEFDLSYHGRMGSVNEWQDMPVGERNWHHAKLADIKKEEKKKHEEATARAKQSPGTRRR